MRTRMSGILAALATAILVLALSGVQATIRALGDPGPVRATADSVLPRLAIAAALLTGALFLARVLVETVRVHRRERAGLWREPRSRPPRLVGYLATSLVGLAAAPPAHAAATPTSVVAVQATSGLVGLSTVASSAGAAVAGEPGVGGVTMGEATTAPDPDWAPTNDGASPPSIRLVGGPSRGSNSSHPDSSHPDPIVVHRGDCLWDIVARALGPTVSEREIAAALPRWYAANRETIGSDPDLLLPGQVLHAPEGRPS